MAAVVNPATSVNTKIKLSDFFESVNPKSYLTYEGSLTTPPCSEAVTWTVFPQAININTAQVC